MLFNALVNYESECQNNHSDNAISNLVAILCNCLNKQFLWYYRLKIISQCCKYAIPQSCTNGCVECELCNVHLCQTRRNRD